MYRRGGAAPSIHFEAGMQLPSTVAEGQNWNRGAVCLMVAVGTRIAPRPPHRSRRALLTHRAPPSGRTSAGRR